MVTSRHVGMPDAACTFPTLREELEQTIMWCGDLTMKMSWIAVLLLSCASFGQQPATNPPAMEGDGPITTIKVNVVARNEDINARYDAVQRGGYQDRRR